MNLQSSNVLLSIVTPVKDGALWIGQCMESVRSLSVPYEHIIVDGGSTDGTLDLIQSGMSKVHLITEVNPGLGMYSAIHDGICASRGRYIAYLNCDDRYLPHQLSTAILFAQNRNIDLLLCDGFSDNREELYYLKNSVPNFPAFFLRRGVIPTIQPSVIFSRTAYLRNPLDLRFKLAGDADLFMRISCDVKSRVGVYRQSVSIFTCRADSLGSTNSRHARKELSLFSKISFFDRIIMFMLRFSAKMIRF